MRGHASSWERSSLWLLGALNDVLVLGVQPLRYEQLLQLSFAEGVAVVDQPLVEVVVAGLEAGDMAKADAPQVVDDLLVEVLPVVALGPNPP